MNKKVLSIYKKLYKDFGPQKWWPAETDLEVMVGAILTQNTSWKNVEKAISGLKKNKLLSIRKMKNASLAELRKSIKPCGFYNEKAKKLKNFIKFLYEFFDGNIKKMKRVKPRIMREMLLGVNGIGEETADSMLLYGLRKPVFVVDAYTKRIFSRHGFIKEKDPYLAVQGFVTGNLPKNTRLFNEYHALIVRLAKEYCRKRDPLCAECPIKNL